jgi:hypothetical protein
MAVGSWARRLSWVKFAALTPSDRHPPRKTNHWIGQNRRYLTVSGLKTMVLCWFHPFLKGSVPIVDTILCHAASVRQKSGGIKINLGDWRWQLAVGQEAIRG